MPADRGVLLDTHALLWWQAASSRLSRRAHGRIGEAERLLVSPLSCWEVGVLVQKGRVRLDRPTADWVRDLLAQERLELAPLGAAVAVAAAELPDFHGDPVDRVLYATARSLLVDLVTKDGPMTRYATQRGGVAVVW